MNQHIKYYLLFVLLPNLVVLSCEDSINPVGDGLFIAEITVFSDDSKLLMGEKASFLLEAIDSEGNKMTNPDIQWHTSNEDIALISNNGILSTHDIGSVDVYASADSAVSNRFGVEVTNMGSGIVATGAVIPFEIIYLSDMTFFEPREGGAPAVFHYYLTSDSYPIIVKFSYNIVITIPEINLSDHKYFWFETDFFTLENGLYLPSYDIVYNPGPFYDLAGNEIDSIGLVFAYDEDFDLGDIVKNGILPPGKYVITIEIEEINGESVSYSFDNPMNWVIKDVSSIFLSTPGGVVDEQREIFNLFPTFTWITTGCQNAMRVSEYDQSEHFSPEDALNAGAVLPFPDDGGYFNLGATTSYTYIDGKPLEQNKTYVWQVKKRCRTSSGDADLFSDIWGFTVR